MKFDKNSSNPSDTPFVMQNVLSNQFNLLEQLKFIESHVKFLSFDPNEKNSDASKDKPYAPAEQLANEKLKNYTSKLTKCTVNLHNLKKNDLSELRSFKMPPSAVRLAGEAVCILFASKPTYDNFTKHLNDPGFQQKLISYDRDAISDYAYEELVKYMKSPDFVPENMAKQNRVASVLCEWVICMYEYKQIVDEINTSKEVDANIQDIGKSISDSVYSFQWPYFYGPDLVSTPANHDHISKLNEAIEKINLKNEKFLSIDEFFKLVDENNSIRNLKEQASKVLFSFAEKYVKSESANVIF